MTTPDDLCPRRVTAKSTGKEFFTLGNLETKVWLQKLYWIPCWMPAEEEKLFIPRRVIDIKDNTEDGEKQI